MSLINEPVLVLNRHYLAVQVSEVRDAICVLFSNKAKVIDDQWITYTFHQWENKTRQIQLNNTELSKYTGILYSPSTAILAPQVIFFPECEYTSPLIKSIRYSRRNIFQRDLYTCQYCYKKFNKDNLSIDHIVPKSRGGTNNWKNVVTCCKQCNMQKGDKLITELGWNLKQEPKEPKWKSHIGKPFNQEKRSYWETFLN